MSAKSPEILNNINRRVRTIITDALNSFDLDANPTQYRFIETVFDCCSCPDKRLARRQDEILVNMLHLVAEGRLNIRDDARAMLDAMSIATWIHSMDSAQRERP